VSEVIVELCRILYWTDWSKKGPAIYRSSVVRPHRETLVSDNLVWPNALAVDFTGKQAFIYRSCVGLSSRPCRRYDWATW